MRLNDIFESSRAAPIFHFMDHEKTLGVFEKDAMAANWEHDIPGIGRVKGNSFTRNKRFQFHSRPVRLVMNQTKLAQRHKIVPLDGEAVFSHTNSGRLSANIKDRRMHASTGNQLAEEFVIGPIQPLHVFLSGVELRPSGPTNMTGAETIELHEVVTAYCEKWSIPLWVDPEYIAVMDEIKLRWKEYEEEDSEDETEVDEAAPSDAMRGRVFYHGTKSTAAAKSIMKQGLKGAEIQSKGMMAPVAGRAYLTQQLRYAIIYAIGGDYLGHDRSADFKGKQAGDPYGYVFIMDGAALEDVQPDEDSVGEFLYTHAERADGIGYRFKGDTTSKEYQIWSFIGRAVTPQQRAKMLDGDYANWAQGGKRALKAMPDWMKHWLIDHDEAHVAATGTLMPLEVWRIDKRKSGKLAKDGSNFFEIAKQVK